MDYGEIVKAASAAGFLCRGGFHPAPEDGVPGAAADGSETLIVLGNAGPAMWRAFQAAPSRAGGLDRWTRAQVSAFARPMKARAFFPFDQPFPPFQRWAAKAENLQASPLGILIHPEYGLWHAYRGALLFAARIALPAAESRPRPCDTCRDKPCLSACPVAAFAVGHYDVPKCVAHVASPRGTECLEQGCLARRACPVGLDHAYAPAQARFHTEAFVRAHRGKS
ncbi:MAG: 4Fe-4S dicluster domain-containing protein [Rhodospirillales bacterium]|nr:4Fe-4S dicluster domain-containing protein [Rhodospirillales bacterium]MSP80139.1 4Fe-4S dicluster domain-containing protein [Rhodospirillales bacterium]